MRGSDEFLQYPMYKVDNSHMNFYKFDRRENRGIDNNTVSVPPPYLDK